MDVGRLISHIKLPSLRGKESSKKDNSQPLSQASAHQFDLRSFLPVVVALAIFILLILFSWWVTPYFDSLYSLIPGYYDIEKYNEMTAEKNEISKSSFELYVHIATLEAQYNDIVASEEGYVQMRDIDTDLIAVFEDLHSLLERSLALDEKLLELRLPTVVQQYVKLSADLDGIRLEVNELSREVSRARRDLNELRLLRSEFDNCLMAVNWNSTESAISDAVSLCTAKIPSMQEKVGQMEIEYGAELESLSQYLVLLKEEWEAESMYYKNIASRDYTKAREYDDIFADRKRQINEIDVIAAFNEFTLETLGPMQEDLIELREKSSAKEKTATQWYKNNIERGR